MSMQDVKLHRKNVSDHKGKHQRSAGGHREDASAPSSNPLSARGLLQMQSALGNRAVLQMVRGRRNAVVDGAPWEQPAAPLMAPPGNLRPPASAEPASPSVPSAALPSSLSDDLTERPNHKKVYVWLKEQAQRSKKTALFQFFDQLNPHQKKAAIDAICGGERVPSVEAAKSSLETGIFRKSVDWDRFSIIAREAHHIDVTDHNADTARDYAGYAAVGSAGLTSGVSGSASLSSTLGASGASGVASGVAPAAAGLGGLATLSQIYNASQDYDGGLSTLEKARLASAEAGGGIGDLARTAATGVNDVRGVAGMGVSGAATLAAGIGGVVGGAAYMVGGIAGFHAARKGAKNLAEIEARVNAQTGGEQADKLGLAAKLGGSTQEMNKSKSGATAVKGALMVAGGAVMLAAAASPIGPALLAAAAILGGIAAVVKFYKKQKRKEQFVDRILKVDEEMKKPENKNEDKAKVRQGLIEAHGFNSVGQCYKQMVTEMADMLYTSGVEGSDAESVGVIENIGLKVDPAKGKPTREMIAKKLNG